MIFEGQATSIQPGDLVVWDKSAKSLVFFRGTREMRGDESPTDDKVYAPFIRDEVNFNDFVPILASAVNLRYEEIDTAVRPTYRFF